MVPVLALLPARPPPFRPPLALPVARDSLRVPALVPTRVPTLPVPVTAVSLLTRSTTPAAAL